MSIAQHALRRALEDARLYRLGLLAALDQLHEAQQSLDCQERIIQRLRDEIRERSGVPTNGELRRLSEVETADL